LVILTFIAFMLYCCKHRIMQCLKRAGFKKAKSKQTIPTVRKTSSGSQETMR
jgi:hypothetical protein